MITHASLFSGIGGAEIAAAWRGWDNLFHCDISEFGLRTLGYWFPNSTEYNDIKKTDFTPWRGRVDVLTGGFPCFVAGTPVLTRRGFIPIDLVQIGDHVLSADGEYHEVVTLMRHEAEELVTMRAQGMWTTLAATPNHPFYVRKKTRNGAAEPEWLPLGECEQGDMIGYPIHEGTDDSHSPAFWRLIGTWLADGWTYEGRRKSKIPQGKRGSRVHSVNHKVVICCGEKNIDRLRGVIINAGYHYTLAKERTAYRAIISNKELCDFLSDFGRYAYGKHLSPQCFGLTEDCKRALLEGWLADGYIDNNGSRKITTVSERLALDMAQIARDAYKRPVSISKKTCRRTCVIEGREVDERPQYCVTIAAGSRYGIYEDGFLWCNIKRLERSPERVTVYNLEVEDEHTYNAYGIAVHNCQPFSSAGKRRGADDDRYLWPQMLRAIREVQPRYVVGENVAGLLSMVEWSEAAPMGGLPDIFGEGRDYFRREGRFTLDRVCGDIEDCGYAVQPVIIPALAVGAPHRRDRVWVLAKRLDTDPDGERQEQGSPQRVQGAAGRHSEVEERDDRLADGVRRPRAAAGPDCKQRQGRGDENKPPRDAGQQPPQLYARPVPPDPGFEKFPTQPPLCGGDDGLSVGLADSPVFGSRRRWVSEALKALGNAWCPQVAYEIFGAIEEDIMNTD